MSEDPGLGGGALDAANRAGHTAGQDLPLFDDLPIDPERANLRLGVELHPECQHLSPLLGVWRGEGQAEYPSLLGQFRYGQQITFSHDGRPFLHYEARAWLLNAAGRVLAPAAREVGWWRAQPDEGVEMVLAHAFGICELWYGGATSESSWELRTDAVVRTESARRHNRGRPAVRHSGQRRPGLRRGAGAAGPAHAATSLGPGWRPVAV